MNILYEMMSPTSSLAFENKYEGLHHAAIVLAYHSERTPAKERENDRHCKPPRGKHTIPTDDEAGIEPPL